MKQINLLQQVNPMDQIQLKDQKKAIKMNLVKLIYFMKLMKQFNLLQQVNPMDQKKPMK